MNMTITDQRTKFFRFEDFIINKSQIAYITQIEENEIIKGNYYFEIRFSNHCMPLRFEYETTRYTDCKYKANQERNRLIDFL